MNKLKTEKDKIKLEYLLACLIFTLGLFNYFLLGLVLGWYGFLFTLPLAYFIEKTTGELVSW